MHFGWAVVSLALVVVAVEYPDWLRNESDLESYHGGAGDSEEGEDQGPADPASAAADGDGDVENCDVPEVESGEEGGAAPEVESGAVPEVESGGDGLVSHTVDQELCVVEKDALLETQMRWNYMVREIKEREHLWQQVNTQLNGVLASLKRLSERDSRFARDFPKRPRVMNNEQGPIMVERNGIAAMVSGSLERGAAAGEPSTGGGAAAAGPAEDSLGHRGWSAGALLPGARCNGSRNLDAIGARNVPGNRHPEGRTTTRRPGWAAEDAEDRGNASDDEEWFLHIW